MVKAKSEKLYKLFLPKTIEDTVFLFQYFTFLLAFFHQAYFKVVYTKSISLTVLLRKLDVSLSKLYVFEWCRIYVFFVRFNKFLIPEVYSLVYFVAH